MSGTVSRFGKSGYRACNLCEVGVKHRAVSAGFAWTANAPVRSALTSSDVAMRRAVVENLYVEAMLLADEAQALFCAVRDGDAQSSCDPGDGSEEAAALWRIGVACESLKTTTRLMHVIAWLLHHRGALNGEGDACWSIGAADLDSQRVDWRLCDHLAEPVQTVVRASEALVDRVLRLDADWSDAIIPQSPALGLQARLWASLCPTRRDRSATPFDPCAVRVARRQHARRGRIGPQSQRQFVAVYGPVRFQSDPGERTIAGRG